MIQLVPKIIQLYQIALTLIVILAIATNSYRRSLRNHLFHKSCCCFGHGTSTKTLLIDNFDSYTYNIYQLLSEINNEEPYVIYNNAFSDWQTLIEKIPYFDNFG